MAAICWLLLVLITYHNSTFHTYYLVECNVQLYNYIVRICMKMFTTLDGSRDFYLEFFLICLSINNQADEKKSAENVPEILTTKHL